MGRRLYCPARRCPLSPCELGVRRPRPRRGGGVSPGFPSPRGPGQQHCPSLPPPHFQWLELWSAANLGLAVPMPQGPQCPDQLRGIWALEAATHPARLDPIWPMFPAFSPYLSGAAAEPGRLSAPVKTLIQVTKTEGLTDRGYRAVPPLDPALCAVFGVKPGLSDRCPTPKDQLTAKLTDRAHRCMMQQEAVMNDKAPGSPCRVLLARSDRE